MKIKFKWPTLPIPSYEALRVYHYAGLAFCILVGLLDYRDGQYAFAMAMSFCGGFNLAGAMYCTSRIRMQANFEMMNAMFNSMVAINNDLMESRFVTDPAEAFKQHPRLH